MLIVYIVFLSIKFQKLRVLQDTFEDLLTTLKIDFEPYFLYTHLTCSDLPFSRSLEIIKVESLFISNLFTSTSQNSGLNFSNVLFLCFISQIVTGRGGEINIRITQILEGLR